jgi:hypothetical protein
MRNCLPKRASEKQSQFPRRRASAGAPRATSGVAGYASPYHDGGDSCQTNPIPGSPAGNLVTPDFDPGRGPAVPNEANWQRSSKVGVTSAKGTKSGGRPTGRTTSRHLYKRSQFRGSQPPAGHRGLQEASGDARPTWRPEPRPDPFRVQRQSWPCQTKPIAGAGPLRPDGPVVRNEANCPEGGSVAGAPDEL